MAGASNIEWTDATWNPIAGCSVVSPGCTNCYAMKMAARVEAMSGARGRSSPYDGLTVKTKAGAVWNGHMRLVESALLQPVRWRKPRDIFVNSMSDLFHEGAPDAWIDQVFAVMALTPQHTYQVLTKRSARMRSYLSDPAMVARVIREAFRIDCEGGAWLSADHQIAGDPIFPLPNVWLGISAEDQTRFDERWPDLEATPAAVRFISYEPALGPVRLGAARPDWLIFGDESGHGRRPADEAWARDIRDDCLAAGADFYLKQRIIGGEKVSLPRLDGVVHDARPAVRA